MTAEQPRCCETECCETECLFPKDLPIIQVYSPDQWHDEQALVMNEAGRIRLIKALESGKDKAVIPAFCCDGEGFFLTIRILPEKEILKLRTPYINEYTHGEDDLYPDPRYSLTPEEHEQVEKGTYYQQY